MNIPFVDLKGQYLSIKTEIDSAISNVFEQSSFIGGSIAKQFETNFSNYIGSKHCVGCGNGTDAIEIALKALEIGQGDEVIVPAMSWISTAEAVTTVGATPVFVDILPNDFTIDPKAIKNKITKKTKAVIPVHLYGKAAKIDEIFEIACDNNLRIIEDSAQAVGSKFGERNIATFGDIATFSFYPSKNLGAYGDAGAIVTNDDKLAIKCRALANHGQLSKHNHIMEGRNSRLDNIQAAILDVKLKYLEKWTEQRINNAKFYNDLLKDLSVSKPQIDTSGRHVFHVYVIKVKNRDSIKEKLARLGISTQIHYPQALTNLRPYSDDNKPFKFPVANDLAKTGLSLPMYPELQRKEIEYVAKCLEDILG